MNESKNKHLTLSQRILIEKGLDENKSIRKIGKEIQKSASTISREINSRKTFISKRYNQPDNSICQYLSNSRKLCNGCDYISSCRRDKWIYVADKAHDEYRDLLVVSREGIDTTKEDFIIMHDIIIKEAKNGLSLYMILCNHPEFDIDIRTLYYYQEKGYLNLTSLDFPRKARFKKRKRKVDKKLTKERKNRIGRTKKDFDELILKTCSNNYTEMDTVEGIKGENLLLTLFHKQTSILLAYKIDNKEANNVVDKLNILKRNLGYEKFHKLFPIILTDNGTEFSDPDSIENNGPDVKETKLFYCDPNRSDQKGSLEVAHEFIRRFKEKGETFNDLSQDQIKLMINHINNSPREKLSGLSAYKVFVKQYGETLAKELGLYYIDGKDIILNKKLFKQG